MPSCPAATLCSLAAGRTACPCWTWGPSRWVGTVGRQGRHGLDSSHQAGPGVLEGYEASGFCGPGGGPGVQGSGGKACADEQSRPSWGRRLSGSCPCPCPQVTASLPLPKQAAVTALCAWKVGSSYTGATDMVAVGTASGCVSLYQITGALDVTGEAGRWWLGPRRWQLGPNG